MLQFARNKLVGVSRKDADTLSVHGILDDDIYGLEVDLRVGIRDLEFRSIEGKWGHWTTPECPRALAVLQEIKGLRVDDEIAGKINKIVGRKGCRHFANLLIECCYAVVEAARVARWEDARAARPDLTLKDFVAQESGVEPGQGDSQSRMGPAIASPAALPKVESARGERTDAGPGTARPESDAQGAVIDLHVHTFPASSCSTVSAEELIKEALRIGLDGICLTDHNHVWTSAQIDSLMQKYGLLVCRGNEITTDQGDMLVFGLDKDIKGIIKIQDLRKEVLDVGGFLIAAHPFRGFLTFSADRLGLTRERAAQRSLFQFVDAVEVLNGKVTEKENQFASGVAQSLGLPATGGSDAHEAAEVGRYATRFWTRVQSEADLIRALKSWEYVPVAYRSENGVPAGEHRLAQTAGR